MQKSKKGRTQSAKLSGMEIQVRYPVGRADLEFREVRPDGSMKDETHTLRLILRSEDARQVAEQFAKLALAIEAAGGAKQ